MGGGGEKSGRKVRRLKSSWSKTPNPGTVASKPIPIPMVAGEMWWIKSVDHNAMAISISNIDFFSSRLHGPIFASDSRRNFSPPSSASFSGGYIHTTKRQVKKIVTTAQGKKARSHWLQYT